MIPKRIIQIHLGGPMPPEVVRWTKSVKDFHPAWDYQLWNEKKVHLAAYNLSELRNKYGSWAAVSNYLRLLIVHEHGGLYLDTDIECLKPMDDLLNFNAFAGFQDDIDGGRICNAVFGATAGHNWVSWQIQNADTELNGDAASGVYAMTKAPRGDLEILPTSFLYPWPAGTPKELRVPKLESYCQHWWLGSWVKK